MGLQGVAAVLDDIGVDKAGNEAFALERGEKLGGKLRRGTITGFGRIGHVEVPDGSKSL